MPKQKFKDEVQRVDVILFKKQVKVLDKLAFESNQTRSGIIRSILAKEIKA